MKDEHITYSDDFTGEVSPDVRTVTFGWMGNYHEVDLNQTNFDKYNGPMQELIAVSRSVKEVAKLDKRSAQRRNRQSDRQARQRAQAIREWAIATGRPVNPRGRISKKLEEEYDKENRD